MNPLKILSLAVLAATLAAPAQENEESSDVRLPSGKSQQEEILKVEHRKAIEDTEKLIKLAEDLKADLEKDEYHVLSVASLKKTEDIERLARKIRERLRR
jgi:hypothetical protein